MNIILQRGVVKKLEELPEYSLALDGIVQGPLSDPEHHRFSLDHHANCLRYCTNSTTMQTWTAISLGLEPEKYNIYINDIDIDICASIWLLQNPDRCSEPLVKKLVDAINLCDMHAGAIHINGMTKTVEWLSAPETDSKRYDDYNKLSTEGLLSILEAILHRIDLYVNGEASIEISKQQKHGEYKILRNENGWVLVESYDTHILGTLFHSGFDKIVVIRPQSDGSHAITFAKKSDFIEGFSLEKIYQKINFLEPGAGGGSTVGGCVRNKDGSRSKLPLETIIKLIDEVILEGKSIK